MKLEQVRALSDEELRTKAAELQGWQEISDDGSCGVPEGFATGFGGCRHCNGNIYDTPNWPADLNACAEMESILTGLQLAHYQDTLYRLCDEYDIAYFHATARQRCEAYVLVMTEGER